MPYICPFQIREETNTRIDLPDEGAESDVITIRGKKEDVLLAKEKILAIQEELVRFLKHFIIIIIPFQNDF